MMPLGSTKYEKAYMGGQIMTDLRLYNLLVITDKQTAKS